jgi:hypothetical protein
MNFSVQGHDKGYDLSFGEAILTAFTLSAGVYALRHEELSEQPKYAEYRFGHKILMVVQCIPGIGLLAGLIERIIVFVVSKFNQENKINSTIPIAQPLKSTPKEVVIADLYPKEGQTEQNSILQFLSEIPATQDVSSNPAKTGECYFAQSDLPSDFTEKLKKCVSSFPDVLVHVEMVVSRINHTVFSQTIQKHLESNKKVLCIILKHASQKAAKETLIEEFHQLLPKLLSKELIILGYFSTNFHSDGINPVIEKKYVLDQEILLKEVEFKLNQVQEKTF